MRILTLKQFIYSFIITAVLFIGIFLSGLNFRPQPVFSGENSGAQACLAVTTVVPVGHQTALRVLATSSTRAWTRISQPLNATNTVSIRFEDALATSLFGIPLQNASTTNGNHFIEFGLDTDFPYTGSVRAITPSASSTIQITDCIYIP